MQRPTYARAAAPKIVVLGASGSGKTTFAAALAPRLGVAHIELDALHHGPNWSAPSAAEFRARVQRAMDASPDGWVVDGSYERKLGNFVTDAADTIVWLDLSLFILLARLTRRTFGRMLNRTELWNGNRETVRGALWGWDSLFAWTIRAFFRHRRDWPRRFAAHPDAVRLRTPGAVRRWRYARQATCQSRSKSDRPS